MSGTANWSEPCPEHLQRKASGSGAEPPFNSKEQPSTFGCLCAHSVSMSLTSPRIKGQKRPYDYPFNKHKNPLEYPIKALHKAKMMCE